MKLPSSHIEAALPASRDRPLRVALISEHASRLARPLDTLPSLAAVVPENAN